MVISYTQRCCRVPAPLNSRTRTRPHFLLWQLQAAGAVTVLIPEALDCCSESPPGFSPQGLNPPLNRLVREPFWALQGCPAAAWRV